MRSLFGTARAFIFALLFVFVASPAWADPAHEAAEYYGQASEAYQAGEYRKAADLLDLAFGKNPDLVYKYNRILALQAAGDAETALAELNALFSPMKADPQRRFDDIDEIKAQLEALTQASATPDPVETPPIEEPPPMEQPPVAPAPAATSRGLNPVGLALTITGGAVLATGGLFATGILVPSHHRKCLGFVGDGNDCSGVHADNPDERFHRSKDVLKQHQIAAISLLGVGAVSTVFGVVLLLSDNGGGERASVGLDSLQLTPYVAGDGPGALLRMRF